jgi:signal transduction histidine kinase
LLASRLSRPLTQLQKHVDRIAQGEFQRMPQPVRNDEVADLARSINQMAAMLSEYDKEVRRTERLKTLGKLGGGIAHQLRNSATGCRMAIELHRRECRYGSDSESLDVAQRQLALMENYIQRFLSVGRRQAPRREPVDLCDVVERAVSLVRPSAAHAGVDLRYHQPDGPALMSGDAERLEQMILNLLLNAVEAAATSSPSTRQTSPSHVCVRLRSGNAGQITLCVEDTGEGPAGDIAEHLFEPFATNKAAGVGLGLCVAREIAQDHGGEIEWSRPAEMTCFTVRLPETSAENCSDKTAGR